MQQTTTAAATDSAAAASSILNAKQPRAQSMDPKHLTNGA